LPPERMIKNHQTAQRGYLAVAPSLTDAGNAMLADKPSP
jgi:hypothetical protein